MMKASAMNVNPFMVCPQCFRQVKVRGIRKHYDASYLIDLRENPLELWKSKTFWKKVFGKIENDMEENPAYPFGECTYFK